MVGSLYLQMMLILTMHHSYCEAVSCFDLQTNSTGFLERKSTCEGDHCVYYQPGAEYKFFEEKSCATGFKLPLGCTNSSVDGSMMCICNTDFCNHGRIEEINDVPQHSCYVDLEKQVSENGTFCMMSYGVHNDTNEVDGFVGVLQGSASYPLPPGYPDLTQFYYHPEIVHAFTLDGGKYRSHRYKCRGDLCNNITIVDLPAAAKNVTCFDGEIREAETAKCTGEFCVYAEDLHRNLAHRHCLSTFNVNSSEYSYKAGLYKYKTTSYYLCQEDGCNFNATTAFVDTTVPVEESKPIVEASFFSRLHVQPEFLFVALLALSATVFISIFILVAQYELIDPKYRGDGESFEE